MERTNSSSPTPPSSCGSSTSSTVAPVAFNPRKFIPARLEIPASINNNNNNHPSSATPKNDDDDMTPIVPGPRSSAITATPTSAAPPSMTARSEEGDPEGTQQQQEDWRSQFLAQMSGPNGVEAQSYWSGDTAYPSGDYANPYSQWRDVNYFFNNRGGGYGGSGGGGGYPDHQQQQMQYYPTGGGGGGGGSSVYNPMYPRSNCSVLSRESSRDDLTSMGDGQIFEFEDRFRVDRRKLELLMLGRFDPVKESAVDFFGRIGDETNSTVIWPSRLKIGAKSKKDPHIRVGGSEDCVRRAKSRIMEYLDTRCNRVTMKMDVSYTDHSHVIGKGGNTIRRVMAETNCHIHFPDSNRSNPNEKSNQVSIAGEIDGVETARSRIRELTPLIFCFDLPIIPSLQNVPDNNDPYLKAIQDQYNIQVTFRQKQKNFHTTMVVVKGSECEAARVKEATMLLMEHLCGNLPSLGGGGFGKGSYNNLVQVVSMNMEISPQHHLIVLGKGNLTLKLIMQRTNTTILFPDALDPNIPSIRKGSVTITGSIHNVYLARQQLIGSLPLVMMFDINDECDLDDQLVQQLQADLDVAISIKPKARQSNKSVIIKAQERNAGSIYKARCALLGLEDDITKATIPESYNLQAVSPTTGMTLPMNHRAFALQSHQPQQYQAPFGNVSGNNNNIKLPSFFAGGGFQTNIPPPPLPSSSPNVPTSPGCFSPTPMTPYQQQSGTPLIPTPHPSASLQPPPHPFAGLYGSSAAAAVAAAAASSFGSSMPSWGRGGGSHQQQQQHPAAYTNALPPNHPFLQDYALLVLNNITRLQQQQQQQLQQQYQQELANAKQRLNSFGGGGGGNGGGGHFVGGFQNPLLQDNQRELMQKLNSINNNVLNVVDRNLGSPPIPGTSPRNSSPVREDGNLTNNFAKLDFSDPSTSGIGTNSSSDKPPSSSTSQASAKNINNSSLVYSAATAVTDRNRAAAGNAAAADFSLLSDRRAPGCEKEITSMFTMAHHGDLADYNQKQLLASKAMHQKPAGEIRRPNPSWVGLGFSSSMPESVIRQRLEEEEQLLLLRKRQQRMGSSSTDEEETEARGERRGSSNSRRYESTILEEEVEEGMAAATYKAVPSTSGSFLPSTFPSSPPITASVAATASSQPQQVKSCGGNSGTNSRQRFLFGNSSAFEALLQPKAEHDWIKSDDDLPSVFARQGLAKYTELFLRQEIDLRTFATLSDEDLKEIGIQTFGARKKLLLLANKTKHAMQENWYSS